MPTQIMWASVAISLLISLSACGGSSSEQSTETPLERMIEPQLDALDKAKDVEDELQDAVKERENAMRENGT